MLIKLLSSDHCDDVGCVLVSARMCHWLLTGAWTCLGYYNLPEVKSSGTSLVTNKVRLVNLAWLAECAEWICTLKPQEWMGGYVSNQLSILDSNIYFVECCWLHRSGYAGTWCGYAWNWWQIVWDKDQVGHSHVQVEELVCLTRWGWGS